jgi:N-acetylmuramoyl-L-alanine amidase
MRKIFISAGHSNRPGRDRGASGNGFIEGELTVELRNLLIKELKDLGVNAIADKDDSILSESINFFKNLTTNTCIVLDLHWNAATPAATGTETLIPATPSAFELDLAAAISKATADILEIPLRGNTNGRAGVKTEASSHHGRLGWMRLTGENVLTETCFITNANDMRKYQERKHILVKELARILFEFAGGRPAPRPVVAPTPAPSPAPQPAATNVQNHTVVSGDTLSGIARRYNTTVQAIRDLNRLTSDSISVGQVLRVR